MGIIVVIVAGQIIHVTFNFNLHGKTQSVQFPIKDIEIFVGPCLVVIEKVSTCAQVSVGLIDAHLRQLRECPTIATSSTHIFYCNNWLQLVGMLVMCTKNNSRHKSLITLWVMLLATNC